MTASAPQSTAPDLFEGVRPLLTFIEAQGLPPLITLGLSGLVALFAIVHMLRWAHQAIEWLGNLLFPRRSTEELITGLQVNQTDMQSQVLAAIERLNESRTDRPLEATDRARLLHALVEIDTNGAAREQAAVSELRRGNAAGLSDLIALDDDELRAMAEVREGRLLRLRRNADLMAVADPAGALELTERALRIAPSDFALKTLRGELLFKLDRLDEASAMFAQVLKGKSKDARLQRIRASDGLARIAIGRGDIAEARKHVEHARSLLESKDPPIYPGVVFERQAEIAGIFGERAEAIRLRREAQTWFDQTNDTSAIARARIGYGHALLLKDEAGRAIKGASKDAAVAFDEALTIARAAQNLREEARALVGKARLARTSGDNATAETLCQEALALARKTGDRRGEADTLRALSLAQSKQNKTAEALQNQIAAYEIDRALNRKGPMADDLANLARFAEERGDHPEAERHLQDAIALQREIGRRTTEADLYARLAAIAVKNGKVDEADNLLGRALNIYLAAGLKDTWRYRQIRQERGRLGKGNRRARAGATPKARSTARPAREPNSKKIAR